MRRLSCALIAALALLALAVGTASAQEMSANVQRIASIPELKAAISINFIDDTMFVSTAAGIYSFDVSDPANPQRLGALPMYIWENEDVSVDPVRKRLFVSRDPRGFTSPATSGDTFPYGAVHIIDVSDPHVMTQLNVFLVGAGHTTTCVNRCDFIWTAGPYANAQTQAQWKGRPIFATDVRDPQNPIPCPEQLDLGRNDGVTDYVHDVQVDSRGIAWVSGAGGVRGYWTEGVHPNPVTGQTETATGCKPIPYAGAGSPESATPSRFIHNSWRDPGPDAVPAVARVVKTCKTTRVKVRTRVAHGHKGRTRYKRKRVCTSRTIQPPAHTMAERTLYATEENIVSDCAQSGRFVTYDLEGTFNGEGFKGDLAKTKPRMTVLDTWTPEKAEGATACDSAHYFTSRGDGIFANAFYTQGVRFLDVSNPRDIRQVGWYHPSDSDTWAAYWHKGKVFVADFQRGVDVLSFNGSPRSRTVQAPVVQSVAPRLQFDRAYYGGLCPLHP